MLADPSEHCSFTAGDAEPILDVQRGSTYLACLSERHLYLWSCSQRCELLCRQTADDAVPPYRRCVWHPDGDALAVLARSGSVLLFDVATLQAAVEGTAPQARLSQYAKTEVDPRCGEGLCLATDGTTLLVGFSGGWLLRLSWAGQPK